MTPEEAISSAFRAASREIATGMTVNKSAAYEGFLTAAHGSLNDSAKALAMVAKYRPTGTPEQLAQFEMYAYNQILQATISSFMALAHFPYLERIESSVVREKLS